MSLLSHSLTPQANDLTIKGMTIKDGPKVLLFDIETAPITAYVWGLFDQNIGLNQIVEDWYVISWAAKWLGAPATHIKYQDLRSGGKNDKSICRAIWSLLDEADIVITQNGKRFDSKKLNSRFIFHGMKPPCPYKHIDTLTIAKKMFGFTSNKLAYMTEHLNSKFKKLEHKKFPGFELWSECLKGNQDAWEEMELYNKHDVLALEELYNKVIAWDASSVDFNHYRESDEYVCKCGSTDFQRRGTATTAMGKFKRIQCKQCGAWGQSRINDLTKDKRRSLRRG